MSLEDMGLRFEGFNDQQIAQIHAILPVIQHLSDVYSKEKANIDKVLSTVQMAVKVINDTQKRFS